MSRERILCVDDEPVVLFAFKRDLQNRYTLVTAESGADALAILKSQEPFAVIMADMMMPEISGVELLAEARRLCPDTVRIMLTGDEQKETAVEAINEGQIFRFLSKPCPLDRLMGALDAGVEHYHLVKAERELLEQTLNGSVKMLTELLCVGEPDAFGRGQKIVEYVHLTAPSLELDHTWDIEVAAMLSQIGLMTIPPMIMQKIQNGLALNDREKTMMTRVPEIGFQVLSKIPRLEPAARIVLHQNKGADGSGFPPISGDSQPIPLGARVLKILGDIVDLETKGVGKRQALEHLRANRRLYDQPFFEKIATALISQEAPVEGAALRLKELLPNHELLSDVKTLDGRLLAPKGTTISSMMLERFHNFAEISGLEEPIYVRRKVRQ